MTSDLCDQLGMVPKPPNTEGSTMCTVRWMVETPGGWLAAWDRKAFDSFASAAVAAERERCAKLQAELRRVQAYIDETPELFEALGPLDHGA